MGASVNMLLPINVTGDDCLHSLAYKCLMLLHWQCHAVALARSDEQPRIHQRLCPGSCDPLHQHQRLSSQHSLSLLCSLPCMPVLMVQTLPTRCWSWTKSATTGRKSSLARCSRCRMRGWSQTWRRPAGTCCSTAACPGMMLCCSSMRTSALCRLLAWPRWAALPAATAFSPFQLLPSFSRFWMLLWLLLLLLAGIAVTLSWSNYHCHTSTVNILL